MTLNSPFLDAVTIQRRGNSAPLTLSIMDTKHTPGPWMRDKKASMRICDTNDRQVAACGGRQSNMENVDDENEANATLIASAPELLEALQSIISQADAQFKAGDRHATFNKQTIDSFRAAIAKATGGKSV